MFNFILPNQVGSNQDKGRESAWYFLIYALALAFYAVFIWRTAFLVNGEVFFSLFDDAMISMRYAQNLAGGHGLVWNSGGGAVEGYTNFLWTLVMAFLHLLALPESKICLAVMLIGAGVLVANLMLVKSLALRVSQNSFAATFASLILAAFYYPLIYWTLRGMEVGIMTLLLNFSILRALDLVEGRPGRNLLALCASLAVAQLVRPDALAPGMVIAVFVILACASQSRKAYGGALFLSLALPVLAHTGFRLLYYGDYLPNTYYLKVTGVGLGERLARGLKVLKQQSLAHLFPLFLPSALLLAAQIRPKRLLSLAPGLWLLLAVFLGQAAYSVYVGGDAWEWFFYANRYIAIAVPALIIFFCTLAVRELSAGYDHGTGFAGRALMVVLLLGGAAALAAGAYILARPGRAPLALGLFDQYQFYRGAAFLGMGLSACLVALVMAGEKRLAGFLAGLPGKRSRTVLWGLACVLFCLLLNFTGYLPWLADGGYHVKDDADMTRRGLFLRENTSPQAKLAVVWSGATPYFARRFCIDLLGKNDRKIAKGRPACEFWPGHNKWDYEHSIGKLRPDVVTSLWGDKQEGEKYLRELGYVKMPNRLFVRRGSRQVNWQGIGKSWAGK